MNEFELVVYLSILCVFLYCILQLISIRKKNNDLMRAYRNHYKKFFKKHSNVADMDSVFYALPERERETFLIRSFQERALCFFYVVFRRTMDMEALFEAFQKDDTLQTVLQMEQHALDTFMGKTKINNYFYRLAYWQSD